MKKSSKRISEGFESASYTTPEFKKLIGNFGCADIKLSAGHFEISGFFTAPNGQVWNVALCDVRFRTVKDYKELARYIK